MCTLFDFLTYILQDQVSGGFFRFDSDDVDKNVTVDGCIELVEETIKTHEAEDTFLHTTGQLLERKRMWDVVTRDKDGYSKEHFFSDLCRRVASHSKKHSTATEHAAVESKEAGRSAYFRSLAIDLFVTELTEEQKKGRKYKLQKNKSLTNQQRSWVNVMLRKNLGNARVGQAISYSTMAFPRS